MTGPRVHGRISGGVHNHGFDRCCGTLQLGLLDLDTKWPFSWLRIGGFKSLLSGMIFQESWSDGCGWQRHSLWSVNVA